MRGHPTPHVGIQTTIERGHPMEEQHLQTGELYRYDGNQLVELEPSTERKIPITEDAHQELSKIRNNISKVLGFRPELSLIASAIITYLSNN
jgi:hypothetical protein